MIEVVINQYDFVEPYNVKRTLTILTKEAKVHFDDLKVGAVFSVNGELHTFSVKGVLHRALDGNFLKLAYQETTLTADGAD